MLIKTSPSLCSISYDLEYLIKSTNKTFNFVAVSKTRITRNTSKLYNIILKSYSFESTPTESSAGGTFLYSEKRYFFLVMAISIC